MLSPTPFDGTTRPFTIGLKPLDPAAWIETNGDLAHMLAVAARQHRDPVAYLILLPADDGTLHQVPLRRVAARISSPVP